MPHAVPDGICGLRGWRRWADLPASYLFVGLPIHLAAGTNKVVNAIGTGTATWKYLRSGKVDLHTALWAAVGALAGAQ